MKTNIYSDITLVKSLPDHWAIDLLKNCDQSKVTGEKSGWGPLYFESENGDFCWGHIKSHSYGEFIFDWAWADLYHRMGMDYYPKLIHALPFTPVNGPKLFGENKEGMVATVFDFYRQQEVLSSDHWLFLNENEVSLFLDLGYIHQKTIQYHFQNKYECFDDYLDSMKMRKRKQIKKERKKVKDYSLEIEYKKAMSLSQEEWRDVYQLYLGTIEKKHSHAYLNFDFFSGLGKNLGDKCFFIFAKKDDSMIAMSMFFEDHEKLYGRYWGIDPVWETEYAFLHFELCYYLGIEYCIEHKKKTFEAGAQGEQKLLRGFEPVVINSVHHLRHAQFFSLVAKHVREMNQKVETEIKALERYLPYKEDSLFKT